MARNVTVYRCLLISPSDLAEERIALSELIASWNAQIGEALRARVELVKWETHSVPDLSGNPQDLLNARIVDECDLAIALFWSRLGQPTKDYKSGSLEEIHRLRNLGRHVMPYFKTAPIPQDKLADGQFKQLKEVEQELRKLGMIGKFSDVSDLKSIIQLDLTTAISDLLTKARATEQGISVSPYNVLPKPEVKLRVSPAIVSNDGNPYALVAISVQNHSASVVYCGNITLKLKDGRIGIALRDGVTGEPQRRRELAPGKSFDFYVTEAQLRPEINPEDLENAIMTDEIGRKYLADPTEFQSAVRSAFK